MAYLQILNGEHRWTRLEVPRVGLTMGRDVEGCCLEDDAWASREHAVIEIATEGFQLRDLGSENGTFLNDDEVRESPLQNGDRLRIGKTEYRFVAPPVAAAVPQDRVTRLEQELARQRRLAETLRAENDRLKRILAGAPSPARPASGPGVHDSSRLRIISEAAQDPRVWTLGRQGLRLGQAILDVGNEDVRVVDHEVKRDSHEDRPELSDLLNRCFGNQQRSLFIAGLKALKLWLREPGAVETPVFVGQGTTFLLLEEGVHLNAQRPWLQWLAAAGLGPIVLCEIPQEQDLGVWVELALVVDAFLRAEDAGLSFGDAAHGRLVTLGTSLAPEVRPQFVDGIVSRASDAGLLYPPFEGLRAKRGTLLLGGRPSGSERARFRRVFSEAFDSSEIETTRDFILADEGSGLRALVTVEGPSIESLGS